MFKSIKGLLAVLAIAAGAQAQGSVWDGSADTDWYDGAETEFIITTAEQLAGLAELVNDGDDMSGKTITLGADIILNDTTGWQNWDASAPDNEWTPIGNNSGYNMTYKFSGTFDGAEFVVSGVYINNSDNYQGLFGVVAGGTIKNLGVAASYVKGNYAVGGLAGYSDDNGTIENCYATGNVTGIEANTGGLVGYNRRGIIENSYAEGNVSGSNSVGGLVGWIEESVIQNCYATGEVTVGDDGFGGGGLVGSNLESVINNCHATGKVTIEDGSFGGGGLVGGNYNGTIEYSYAVGNVTGDAVGGLVGENEDGTITNSYYDSDKSGQDDDDGRGEPKTTAEMKQQATYSGWNFTNIWGIAANINDGYPHLQSLLQSYEIFVAVTDISGIPTTATYNQNIVLNATVAPSDATNQTIVWSVVGSGAAISGSSITFTQAGTVTIRATITDGSGEGSDYTQDFAITVAKANPTYTLPAGLTATVGQTLANVELPSGWSWENTETEVGEAGAQTHKAKFTPSDTDNYNILSNIDVTVTVENATPIRSLPQLASQISIQTTGKTIMLGNLPGNAKIEMYNLQGKCTYSANSGNSQSLKISVQTNGIYFIKISLGSEKQILRVPVR